MAQIKPWLDYFVRQAGVPGIVGIAILAAVPAYYMSVTRPLKTSIPQLRAEYAAATRSQVSAGAVVRTRMTRQDRIEDFHNFFPQQKHALGWIGVLYKAAEREDLQLIHGEYRAAGKPDKHPAQMQILLPVRGSYAQIRRFVTGALAEIPFLALDEIDFQRSASGGSTIEAKIRFTLYLRGS